MIVSWDWLTQYVDVKASHDEVTQRLMLAGLNHDGTEAVEGDFAINLEVTSNRPDCLGHLGIAREVAVLFDRTLKVPAADPREGSTSVKDLAQVDLRAPELCPRYTARVIRGLKIAGSPQWLTSRLRTLGIPAINNVVDITNYVLFECGQPLHAFDLSRLAGRRIVVRKANAGEKFLAINHKTYELDPSVCVIADAEQAVALGGVMGGASSEVSSSTSEVLLESAEFDPLAIRNTARRLNLHSDSSYRFERGVDPQGVEWASRRACELILELAGGELARGVVDVGRPPPKREPVTLRFSQLLRILGIEIASDRARQILVALGNRELEANGQRVVVAPPSWRRDLTREIDLVEEVARIEGYDKIPEDVRVPMATSHRTREDRVLERVRHVLTGAGFDEAMTLSAVEPPWSDAFSPWTGEAALRCSTPVLRRADTLRRSLIPSLLGARRANQAVGNDIVDLFEIAHVYLPSAKAGQLPREELVLGIASGRDFLDLKGVVEAIVSALNPLVRVEVEPTAQQLLDPSESGEVQVRGRAAGSDPLGYLGQVSAAGLKQFELRGATAVAELRLQLLDDVAQLVPQYTKPAAYPAVTRDLNFVVDERTRWADLERTIASVSGPNVEHVEFQGVYRDPEKLAPGKKSLLVQLILRSHEGTLTGEEADQICALVVSACRERLGAELRV